MFDRMPKIVG